jgi:hypothetical protein
MSKMKDSGELILGTSNTSIDLFDNPFISIKAYKITEKYELKEEIPLKKCTKDDIGNMMSESL